MIYVYYCGPPLFKRKLAAAERSPHGASRQLFGFLVENPTNVWRVSRILSEAFVRSVCDLNVQANPLCSELHIYIYIYISLSLYIYIYMYRERERER